MSQEWDYPPPRWKAERFEARIEGRVIEHQEQRRKFQKTNSAAAIYTKILKIALGITALLLVGLFSCVATMFFYFLIKSQL